MKQLLLVLSFFTIITDCFSQPPRQLHLKKYGGIKKRIEIGTDIIVYTDTKEIFRGTLINFKSDSIYFSYATVALNNITTVKFPRTKEKMHFNSEQFGYITLGVALTTGGLVAAGWKEFPAALAIASAIGYSPYLFGLLKSISLRKRQFKIDRRFTLRIWDIH